MDQKSLIDPALMESLGLEFDENYEAKLAKRRSYYAENRAAILATDLRWRKRNRDKLRTQNQARRDADRRGYRKRQRKSMRKASATLSDSYVKLVLSMNARYAFGRSPPVSEFPKELVEAKRAELLLKRKLQNRKLKHKGNHESQETSNPA